MPRNRSLPAPRSVRHLTHQPKRLAKKLKIEKAIEEAPVESHEEYRKRLIREHAEARAERHHSSFGVSGMLAVIVTCGAIFVGWWFLPGIFSPKKAPIAIATPTPVPVVIPTSTSPLVSGVVPGAAVTSSVVVPTSTPRRLLLPLTPTSTKSSR